MIRIDEIYQNIFLPKALTKEGVALHWFDPFGSTDINDIVNLPPVDGVAEKRMIFWDQEPLHKDRLESFFQRFCSIYDGPKTLVTSEKNSEDLDWVCKTFGLKHQYYFFHAWAALDWYRGYNRSFLGIPFKDKKIKKLFLCMNNIIGGRRQHRLLLFKQMVDRELLPKGFVSFPDVCPYENRSAQSLYDDYGISLDLGHVSLPLKIDDGSDYHISSSKIDFWDLSNNSLLHIVTETVYNGRKSHLTEKTFKPIVAQQPFVIVSCQGSLDYLRSYGFKTFGDFWDESYDEQDDATRISSIGKLIKDLGDISSTELVQLQKNLVPIVEHNFKWFYSQEFESLIWQELSEILKTI